MPRGPGDFGKAFTALLRAAGLNPDGVRRALPGVVSRSVLYDWMKGAHLPADTEPLVDVVELCLERAGRGLDVGGVRGDVDGWLELLAEAKQTRDSEVERRRMPRRLPASTADADGGAGQVVDEGWPVERWGPLRLGVHRAIGGGLLPAYVRRAHDHLLYAVLNPQVAANRLVVLRGGSSTGKSRAAYEAVRARLPRVPVLYPRTAADLAALLDRCVLNGSVLWLNELRHYAEDAGGQRTLARLADVLMGRDHLVVITSVWPEYWAAYVVDHHDGPGTADPVSATRALLTALPELNGVSPVSINAAGGGVIDVPMAFTAEDLTRARRRGDPLLEEAIVAAEVAGAPGQVTQYLAGLPALLEHYQGPGADPYGQALITAAMDAVRLGHHHPLGQELLQQAAEDYLAPPHRALPELGWHEAMAKASAYATRTLKGAVRALEPVPPERGIGVAGYRLAHYLDQHADRYRRERIPPRSFWTAAATYASPADLASLGDAAWRRGLYRIGAQLLKDAAVNGNADAAVSLVERLHSLDPTDHRAANWAATHVPLDDPVVIGRLLNLFAKIGGDAEVHTLLARNPAASVCLDRTYAVGSLLETLREAGAGEQATALLARDPVARVPLDAPVPVARLLDTLRQVGADDHVQALVARDPAACVAIDDPAAVLDLLYSVAQVGASDQVNALATRVIAYRHRYDPRHVATLLSILGMIGANDHVVALAERAAAECALDARGVAWFLMALREVGAEQPLMTLLARNPAMHIPLEPFDVHRLWEGLQAVGAAEQVAVLLARDPAAHVGLSDVFSVGALLEWMREVGADGQVTALAERVAAGADLTHARGVAWLLDSLGKAGAQEQVAALLTRDPAACVALDDPAGIADLLASLRNVGADEQFTALAERAVENVAVEDADGVAMLLKVLGQAAHGAQFAALADRAAGGVEVEDTDAVAALLKVLRRFDAGEPFCVLAERAVTQASLDFPFAVTSLLDSLRGAEADELVIRLAERVAAAGLFDQFMTVADHQERFWFGREPDGTAAEPWTWDELK
ncbi:hypothetical protein GCM10029978_068430 [Actinoallomurus acanthiterrae]